MKFRVRQLPWWKCRMYGGILTYKGKKTRDVISVITTSAQEVRKLIIWLPLVCSRYRFLQQMRRPPCHQVQKCKLSIRDPVRRCSFSFVHYPHLQFIKALFCHSALILVDIGATILPLFPTSPLWCIWGRFCSFSLVQYRSSTQNKGPWLNTPHVRMKRPPRTKPASTPRRGAPTLGPLAEKPFQVSEACNLGISNHRFHDATT